MKLNDDGTKNLKKKTKNLISKRKNGYKNVKMDIKT